MTADMLRHLGGYLHREYGHAYRVERFDVGVWDTVAHIVATDGSRWRILIEATPGCRWEDSTITDPAPDVAHLVDSAPQPAPSSTQR